MVYDVADVEALRMMRAFRDIKDAETRRCIIAMTEAAARRETIKVEKPIDLPKSDV